MRQFSSTTVPQDLPLRPPASLNAKYAPTLAGRSKVLWDLASTNQVSNTFTCTNRTKASTTKICHKCVFLYKFAASATKANQPKPRNSQNSKFMLGLSSYSNPRIWRNAMSCLISNFSLSMSPPWQESESYLELKLALIRNHGASPSSSYQIPLPLALVAMPP